MEDAFFSYSRLRHTKLHIAHRLNAVSLISLLFLFKIKANALILRGKPWKRK